MGFEWTPSSAVLEERAYKRNQKQESVIQKGEAANYSKDKAGYRPNRPERDKREELLIFLFAGSRNQYVYFAKGWKVHETFLGGKVTCYDRIRKIIFATTFRKVLELPVGEYKFATETGLLQYTF